MDRSVPRRTAPMVLLTGARPAGGWCGEAPHGPHGRPGHRRDGRVPAGRPRAGRRAGRARWIPHAAETLQYQLTEPIDTSVDATIYDIDLFAARPAVIAALQAQGRHVLCYLDAGSWEPYRPDAARFPASVKGKAVAGLGGRALARHPATGRAQAADGAPDSTAARRRASTASSTTGSTATSRTPASRSRKADQLRYDRWLAKAAHARGLAVAQKNGPGLVRDLVETWDLAVAEECFQYAECWRYAPYLDAGKPVLDVEYRLTRDAFCPRAAAMGIAAIRKRLQLDAWRAAC